MDKQTVPFSGEVFLPRVFKISPLVRIALWSFYTALTLPLLFLSRLAIAEQSMSKLPFWLGMGFMSGGVLLHMVLSEQVHVKESGIAVYYPGWVPSLLRRDWALDWSEIGDFKARSTGQGGLVYYLISKNQQGFLLPMRVVGFERMLNLIEMKTGIDTRDVKPLAQPWMYGTLLAVSALLMMFDVWVIWTVLNQPSLV